MTPAENLSSLRSALLLGAILVLAATLRLEHLTDQSLWLDETVSWDQSRGTLPQLFQSVSGDNYPPLNNLILYVVIKLFGGDAWTLRLPSALLGTGTVGLVYLIGRRLGGDWTATIAALLLTFSPFHIWYSQEVRMYAVLGFSAPLLFLAILVYLERPAWPASVFAAIAALCLLYSHYYGILTWAVLAAGGVLLAPRRRRRTLLIGQLVAIAAFLPWLLRGRLRFARMATRGFWIPPLTPSSGAHALADLLSGPLPAFALALGIAIALWPRRRAGAPPAPAPGLTLLVLGWIALPMAAVAAVSLAIVPLVHPRYFIAQLPAIYLLSALGFVRLRTMIATRATSLWVGGALVGMALMALVGPTERPNWRLLTQGLSSHNLTATDCVVSIPEFEFTPLAYYLPEARPCGVPHDQLPPALAASRIFVAVEVDDPDALNQMHHTAGLLTTAGWTLDPVQFDRPLLMTFRPPAPPRP